MYEENRPMAVPQFQDRATIGGIAAAQMQQAGKAPRDVSQWEVAAKRHAEVLSQLTERIKILADRLHPVLRPSPQPPTSSGQLNKQQEVLAPVAQGMHQISDEVEHLVYIVSDVLNRLEL